MRKDKSSKPTWAKLARKPGKATSKDLKKALQDLEADKAQLGKRKAELEKLTIELALNDLAGDAEPSPGGETLASVRVERQDISERLSVMDRATGLLQDAIQKAAKREKEVRRKEIIVEIEHMKKMAEADYTKGLQKLAEAMPFLTSAMQGNPGDPLGFFDRLNRIKPTMGFSFQAKFNEEFAKLKPKIHASGRIATLRLELKDLEKTLQVGEFASTGPRKNPNVNAAPRIPVGFTDPVPSGPGDADGPFAEYIMDSDNKFAV